MNGLGYPIVTPSTPIFTLVVKGVDLSAIVSVGETALYIKRVGEATEYVKYFPFSVVDNKFMFTFDNLIFDYKPGRFSGRLVYKGVEIQSVQFIVKVDPVTIVGDINV